MCTSGRTLLVKVWIPSTLTKTGIGYWNRKAIDICIAPLVDYLQSNGINMLSSCCGHRKKDGEIVLEDNSRIVIPKDNRSGMYLTNSEGIQIQPDQYKETFKNLLKFCKQE